MKKQVLVVGGTGLVGNPKAHLYKRLKRLLRLSVRV